MPAYTIDPVFQEIISPSILNSTYEATLYRSSLEATNSVLPESDLHVITDDAEPAKALKDKSNRPIVVSVFFMIFSFLKFRLDPIDLFN